MDILVALAIVIHAATGVYIFCLKSPFSLFWMHPEVELPDGTGISIDLILSKSSVLFPRAAVIYVTASCRKLQFLRYH